MIIKQHLSSLLICALAIIPMVSFGQTDTLYVQFHPQCDATFLKEIGNGRMVDELIYQKSGPNDEEIVFFIKGLMFIHHARTMKKTEVLKKSARFSSDPVAVNEIEKYITNLQKMYPFGGLPSQPGVKRLIIVEDDGGDFFTLYEVKWKLNL